MAPIAGMYDPAAGEARAIDVALFVLMIGGFLGVVTKTGAIDAGIGRAMTALKGREIWMIPILMALFAAGGTSYGMAEESLAFYALIIPVMIADGRRDHHARRRHRHARLDRESLRNGDRVERGPDSVHRRYLGARSYSRIGLACVRRLRHAVRGARQGQSGGFARRRPESRQRETLPQR
jgi:hypothetical protein